MCEVLAPKSPEDMLDYVIYDVMGDDSSFDRISPVKALTKTRHIYAMAGGLVWKQPGLPERVETVVIPPACVPDTTAAAYWQSFNQMSPVPMNLPEAGAARLRSVLLLHDSVSAHQMLFHHLVSSTRLPGDGADKKEVLCFQVPCAQHGTASCLTPMTLHVGSLNPTFAAACTLSSGHTSDSVRSNFREAFVEDTIVKNPDEWEEDPEATGYSKNLLECCYVDRVLYSSKSNDEKYLAAEETYRRARADRLRAILPGPWWFPFPPYAVPHPEISLKDFNFEL